MKKVPTISIGRFAKGRGLITDADVLGHIHAGLRSAPQTKTYQRWNTKELRRLQDARDETVRLYREAVESGEIPSQTMSRREGLEAGANGHPDLASTQAAKRLLAKMDAA